MERKFAWRGDLHEREIDTKKRLTWKGDIYEDIHGEET